MALLLLSGVSLDDIRRLSYYGVVNLLQARTRTGPYRRRRRRDILSEQTPTEDFAAMFRRI